MQNDAPLEIERKFLIKFPDISKLALIPGCKITQITQTYLLCQNGCLRVRKSVCDGKTVFKRTQKTKISDITRLEDEKEISQETYNELLLCADGKRTPVLKTRYAFPHNDRIIEIDVYPFWTDRAVAEIELQAENETIDFPNFLQIIKEVTHDNRYSNKSLAKQIITEPLNLNE